MEAASRLVGDHHQLHRRQRQAIQRAACSEESARNRHSRRSTIPTGPVVVDGFNVIVTVEAALSGGVLLVGHDGLLRDLSSVHGNYRRVEETSLALGLLVAALAGAEPVCWLLDRPVSNSGRLAEMLRERGQEALLVDAADREAATRCATGAALASADGPLLDRVERSVDLTGPLVRAMPGAWVVDLSA